MEKVKSFVAQAIAVVTGYGLYGFAFLAWALLAWFLGFNIVAAVLVGVFIGKNIQAIKTAVNSIKF